MVAPSCSECGGTRWVRYFSETTDGNFEEAFRLCLCNYEPEAGTERECEESERVIIAEDIEEGILIRPAVAVPLESYTPDRKVEFLLSNAVDKEDYAHTEDKVRRMGLDPNTIRHRKL